MKSFKFPLQRILDWRKLQLRAEEEKLSGMQRRLAALIHRENSLRIAQSRSEAALRGFETVSGSDLRALAEFQVRIKHEQAAIKANRTKSEALIAEHLTRLLKARKDCRILEKLREDRHKAWIQLGEREVEEVAAESYLANWARANSEPQET